MQPNMVKLLRCVYENLTTDHPIDLTRYQVPIVTRAVLD